MLSSVFDLQTHKNYKIYTLKSQKEYLKKNQK